MTGPVGADSAVPVGIAVLGCAHRPHAWSYARAVASSARARLVGVYDQDADLAHAVADDAGAPVVQDAVALCADPAVQAVVVCSPTARHRADVELAAAHGLHVLCEKPVATTAEDAREMVAATRAAGVQLHLAFVSRFLPQVREVKTALDAGVLGTVLGVRAGNRGRPPLPPHYPGWITDPDQSGGGALVDHAVHLVDLVRHLTGREVARVAAEIGLMLWSAAVEDCVLMSLELDSGAVAGLDPSWSVPADNPWDYDFFLRVVASHGSGDLDDLAASVRLVSPRAGNGLRLVGFGEDPDAALVEAFVSSILAGELLEPCASGEDGLRSLEVALAGYASARDGGRFVVPHGGTRP